jgi:hypothetical protein
MDKNIQISCEPHALERARERGASLECIHNAVYLGEPILAKKKRTEFRAVFDYHDFWEGKYYRNIQLRVIAAPSQHGWHVITVITEFF